MRTILLMFAAMWATFCPAQSLPDYQAIDRSDPIVFGGDFIIYQGDSILLGPKAFFVDGQLTDEEVASYPFVFNSIQSAAEQLNNGSEEEPMTLYLAPYVYWIDDPDDPVIRYPEEGDRAPYGMTIECEWLTFFGLTEDPNKVILACNRGQTIGARGNFTLFRFRGDGTRSENLTFGNYCNVDLDYPLKPELSREKRASAIVQAQLIHCNGDKIVARNTRFISRLNLCPFVGGKRVLFDRCHFESTDDALCGTGVYLNSTFDFYSSKPFYYTRGTGAVFLNCDIRALTEKNQYFTKVNGQLAVVDTRIESPDPDLYLGWRDLPPAQMRNYQYAVSLNGKEAMISKRDSYSTVDMAGERLLDAYRFEVGGQVVYNTYNLLRGDDDWDPMKVQVSVMQAEREHGRSYRNIPTQLLINGEQTALETGKDSARLAARLLRFGNYEAEPEPLHWQLLDRGEEVAELRLAPDGQRCWVIPTNTTDVAQEVVVTATTPAGLEAAYVLQIKPRILAAPGFANLPTLIRSGEGILQVDYQLDTDYPDQSDITWYRCTDSQGSNPVEVAVSRFGRPLRTYELGAGDAGYYIKATIAPKHIRSRQGESIDLMTDQPIGPGDGYEVGREYRPDFSTLSLRNQTSILPGFWYWGHLPETELDEQQDAWYYGTGKDGAANLDGLLQGRSGLMGYTPLEDSLSNMRVLLDVAPYKSAGQGFSVAPLYMDVLIKFDFQSRSGYGLRLIRTTKYHNAVDFQFVEYRNGKVEVISDPVSASCYRTTCYIELAFKDGRLLARAHTDSDYNATAYPPEVLSVVEIETTVTGNTSGGAGIWYQGGASAVIRDMVLSWE